MSARLSEIQQRLEAAKSAVSVQLPNVFANCWVVPGKCIAASLGLAHLFSNAEDDLEYLIRMVSK